MPVKKVQALRDLTREELLLEERDLRKELFNLRFQKVLGQFENPMRLREVRLSIARVKTICREKEETG
jgi:large subunit ribosomal protein L29